MKNQYKKYAVAVLFLGAIASTKTVKAQLNPLASQYFDNQYLFNPAMAGITDGLNINLDYRKQSLGVSGSAQTQSVTADYLINRVGLGVNVYNDVSGLLRTSRAVVTYAYHLPLSGDNQKLNFGLSGGLLNQHVQTSDLVGDAGDASVARFNDKQNYFDGDFGVSYTSNTFTVQAALPNLKNVFNNENTVDNALYFAAASYKLGDPKDMSFEPKVVYRGLKSEKGIIDAGANLAFNANLFSIQGMYHSNNSATFGFGVHKSSYGVFAFYTTTTASLGNNTNGDLEIGLKFKL